MRFVQHLLVYSLNSKGNVRCKSGDVSPFIHTSCVPVALPTGFLCDCQLVGRAWTNEPVSWHSSTTMSSNGSEPVQYQQPQRPPLFAVCSTDAGHQHRSVRAAGKQYDGLAVLLDTRA